jgi:tRNA-Thr(GGU) m(6)t(6)A37 methyltransferase TsaA
MLGVGAVAIAVSILSWKKLVDVKKELITLEKQLQQQRKQSKDRGWEERPFMKATKIERNETLLDVNESLTLYPIGTICSVFQLCTGTPRQGLLAPSTRGRIHLHKLGDSSTAEAITGLEGFSHLWILFVFHLNTQSSSQSRRLKSKISPPALGGQKLGVYATRSPHRANPIGITLCKLDRIQVDSPHDVTLHISGLDLVDGTPVLDIKPYVPVYDSVSAVRKDESSDPFTTLFHTPPHATGSLLSSSVPDWVDGGLKTFRQVVVTEKAKQDLKRILDDNPSALQFYGPEYGEDVEATVVTVLQCITQVLAIDVRSSYQTQKTRKGKVQVERAKRLQSHLGRSRDEDSVNIDVQQNQQRPDEQQLCTQQLDNLIIAYHVECQEQPLRSMSNNSGAEDLILVTSIELLARR